MYKQDDNDVRLKLLAGSFLTSEWDKDVQREGGE